MTESTDREGPSDEDVQTARDALARPGDEDAADGTTRDAATEPDAAPEE